MLGPGATNGAPVVGETWWNMSPLRNRRVREIGKGSRVVRGGRLSMASIEGRVGRGGAGRGEDWDSC